MTDTTIDYAAFVREALEGVVRRSLLVAATDGLPGEHHFVLTFRTTQAGVALPRFLRELHPERMTIVIQHQFWDLDVGESDFGITLAFGGKRHALRVPYAALVTFVDPAARFGLQFESDEGAAETAAIARELEADLPSAAPAGAGDVLPFSPRPRR